MEPSASVAVPLIVVAIAGARNAFAVGDVMPTVGATPVAPVTVTARALDNAERPIESTTRASSRWRPRLFGAVKRNVYGGPVSVATTDWLNNNSTRSMPVAGVVVTVTTRVEPIGTDVVPVIAIVAVGAPAAETTVTPTAEDSVTPFTLSVARAVRATGPAVVGVQLTEKGAVVSVPIGTPLAKNWTLSTERPAP